MCKPKDYPHLVFVRVVKDYGSAVSRPRHDLVSHPQAALQRVSGRVLERHVHAEPEIARRGVRRDGAVRVQRRKEGERKRRAQHQVAAHHLAGAEERVKKSKHAHGLLTSVEA